MSYDPTQPTVYFDIGEAIAAIGILLAFVAIANPRRQFRWSLGWFRLRTAYFLFFFGILSVIIAAILPAAPFKVPGITGWPIFWEVTAGLVFAFGSLGLILSGSHPIALTERNGKDFFHLCYSVIARGDDQELGALAEEVAANAKTVIRLAQGYDRFRAYAANESGKEYKVSEPVQWACNLMDLWSDRRFCNVIVTRCPVTAINIFCEIKRQRLYNSCGYSFVQQLIAEAFRDPNSILHREERRSGLGHFLPFTETVFGDYALVDSMFRPLQSAGYQHDNLRDVEKYSQCLLHAMKSYFDNKNFHADTAALWCGVEVLSKSGLALVGRMQNETPTRQYTDSPGWALHRVTETFKEIIKLIQMHESELPEYEFDASDLEGFKDKTIYGIVARGIYDFYNGLTRSHGHDWEIRDAALDIWMDIYWTPSSKAATRTALEIQKRLESRLWAQVKKNLEDRHLCYPMITRLLISIMGLGENPDASVGWRRVSEQLRRTIKEKFKRATQLDEKRASELLPEDYVYDKEKNAIVMKNRWGGDDQVFACE